MSNLLDKASIVTTPTAYENGKILSVKPAPSLSSELVTNGGFDTDSDWVKGTGTTISGGNANFVNANGVSLYQNIGTQSGFVKITFNVTDYTSGTLNVYSGGNQSVGSINVSANALGAYTAYIDRNGGNVNIIFGSNDSFNGSIDNVSVKEAIDADFDFTRNSSATRVNSQGLIEDMQILSSNLVSNGDFSQEGSELVTNGDFATDSDWTLGTGVTISGGKANWTNTINNVGVTQSGIMTNGKNYKVVFTVSNYSSGSVRLRFPSITERVTSNGTYTYYINATDTNLYIQGETNGDANVNFSIDNVSVKEVGQDWTLGAGWSIGDDKVIATSMSNQFVTQSFTFTSGKRYKASFSVAGTSSLPNNASLRLPYDGSTSNIAYVNQNSDGVYSHEFISNGSLTLYLGYGSFTGSISNISVIEITSDTNLPRIDYTGGVGHWLFEPQSTNLVTYSKDFSQWAFVGGATQTPSYSTSPSNLNDATMLNVTNAYIRLAITGKTSSSNQSIFVKRGGTNPATHIRLTSNNTSAWNTGSSLKYELTEDWTRINLQDGILTSSAFIIIGSVDETNTMDSDCNGTSLIWGAQVEDQSFATSIIPTSGSTVTRLQDAAFGAGSSDLINSTEGVLYAEIAALSNDGTSRLIGLSDGTTTKRINIYYDTSSNSIYGLLLNSSVQAITSFILSDSTNFAKIAFKYKENDFALWVNGTEVDTDSSGTTFTSDTLNKLSFDRADGVAPFYGKVKSVAVFKEALTDAELNCLTTI